MRKGANFLEDSTFIFHSRDDVILCYLFCTFISFGSLALKQIDSIESYIHKIILNVPAVILPLCTQHRTVSQYSGCCCDKKQYYEAASIGRR